jgi:hypothetical protein
MEQARENDGTYTLYMYEYQKHSLKVLARTNNDLVLFSFNAYNRILKRDTRKVLHMEQELPTLCVARY